MKKLLTLLTLVLLSNIAFSQTKIVCKATLVYSWYQDKVLMYEPKDMTKEERFHFNEITNSLKTIDNLDVSVKVVCKPHGSDELIVLYQMTHLSYGTITNRYKTLEEFKKLYCN